MGREVEPESQVIEVVLRGVYPEWCNDLISHALPPVVVERNARARLDSLNSWGAAVLFTIANCAQLP